jgi:hypothetical protein
LRNRVLEVFGTFEEQHAAWKIGRDPEEVFDRCFDIMYDWDADFFVCDPFHAIGDYAVEKKRGL